MKIGFNEATARDCSNLEQDLTLCEAAGFEAIELRIDMIRTYLEDHDRDQLRKLLKSKRIQAVNLNAIYPYEELFSTQDDMERRQVFLKDFCFACETAQSIGANALVLCPPLKADRCSPFTSSLEEQHRMNVRIVAGLAEIAAQTDTKLCFEIVGARYSSCRTVAEAKAVLNEVKRPNVGLAVDTYNIYMGCPEDGFAELSLLSPEDIFIAHINDADVTPLEQLGDQSRRCFCGSGVLDIAAYLDRLRKIGYDGVISVETFRTEYWKKSAQWVVAEAYRTTRNALEANCCLS